MWIKIPGRVELIQGLEVHEATMCQRQPAWVMRPARKLTLKPLRMFAELIDWFARLQWVNRCIDKRNPWCFSKERFLIHNAVLSIGVINYIGSKLSSLQVVRRINSWSFFVFTTYSCIDMILPTVFRPRYRISTLRSTGFIIGENFFSLRKQGAYHQHIQKKRVAIGLTSLNSFMHS